MYTFRFDVVMRNLPFLLEGLGLTVQITFISVLCAMVVGLVAALLRLSKLPGITQLVRGYIDLFRCTPVLVQLVWVYYALPLVVGIRMSAFTSTVLTLTLNMGAFLGEIFRAGIQSIDVGQREAAFVLGMTYRQTLRRIILPQALVRMLPPIGSSMIMLLKESSLASFIAVAELTYQGHVLQAATFRPIEILTVVAAIYFILTFPLSLLVQYLERRAGIGERL
jgi:polar amino acid transport system permease protein